MKSRLLALGLAVPALWLLYAARFGAPTSTAGDADPVAYAVGLCVVALLLVVLRLADRAPFARDPGLHRVGIAVEACVFLLAAAGGPGVLAGDLELGPTIVGALLGGVAVSALAAAHADREHAPARARRHGVHGRRR